MEASEIVQANEGAEGQATQDSGAENQETAPETPDVSEQLTALTQRLDRAFPEQEQAQEETDLFGLLTAEEPDEGDYDQGADQTVPEAQGSEQPDEQQVEAAFNEAIRERVAEQVTPYFEAFEMQRRETAIGDLVQKYPDLKKPEVAQAISQRLGHAAESYGNDLIRSDPGLVELALLAHRAQTGAANEVPADQARNQGANLETGTGAGADGSLSDDEQLKRDILGAGTGGGGPF